MKVIKLFFILFIGVFSNTLFANESQIREIMAKQEAAWNQGNLEGFMQGYWKSKELKFVGKNGIKKGWQTTLDNYKKSYPDTDAMGKLKFTILDIQVEGSSAFVLGKWKLTRKNDTPNGFYTLFWKKIDEQWKIVIDHSS